MTAGRAEPFGNKTKRRSETKQKGDRPAAESVTAKNETSVFAKTQKRGRSLYGETERMGETERNGEIERRNRGFAFDGGRAATLI